MSDETAPPQRRYEKTVSATIMELVALLRERDDINRRLLVRYAAVRSLTALAGEGWEQQEYLRDIRARIFQPISLLEGVRVAIEVSTSPMKPTDVRDWLAEWGYDTRRYTYAMAAIHRCLQVLVGRG